MNIFVASLPFSTEEEELRDAFENYGEVDTVKIVTDRNTGRSKGFGFVEMSDEAEAQTAIDALHDSSMQGRQIVVKQARPKSDNGYGGAYRQRY